MCLNEFHTHMCTLYYTVIIAIRLGFDWEPRENYWMDMYQQLRAYLAKSGGKMPPRFINNQKFALGQWCDTQLDNYRKLQSGKKGAYITPRKIEMLEKIGYVFCDVPCLLFVLNVCIHWS